MAIDFDSHYNRKRNHNIIEINLFTILFILSLIIAFILLFFNKNVFAKSDTPVYEENSKTINIQNIVSANARSNKI